MEGVFSVSKCSILKYVCLFLLHSEKGWLGNLFSNVVQCHCMFSLTTVLMRLHFVPMDKLGSDNKTQ